MAGIEPAFDLLLYPLSYPAHGRKEIRTPDPQVMVDIAPLIQQHTTSYYRRTVVFSKTLTWFAANSSTPILP
jgi:hypothetical protein